MRIFRLQLADVFSCGTVNASLGPIRYWKNSTVRFRFHTEETYWATRCMSGKSFIPRLTAMDKTSRFSEIIFMWTGSVLLSCFHRKTPAGSFVPGKTKPHAKKASIITRMEYDSVIPTTCFIQRQHRRNGLSLLSQFIRKAFLISDNDAYNRMYEFVGQETINRRLSEWIPGYENHTPVHALTELETDIPIRFASGQRW
jgi:hypothetical protein